MKRSNRELFFGHIAQTSDLPLGIEIEKADGVYLYSKDKTYIDCISGISVSNVGHNNASVIQAIKDQADKHLHLMVYGEIIQSAQTQLADKLTEYLPASLQNIYFVNSGSEAIEASMKLAKRYTRRSRFVAQRLAYHGSTQGAMSLMSDAYFSQKFAPLLPGIDFIEQNNIDAIEHLITEETAAVFIEPVMGEKGYVPCDLDYLKALRKRCDETKTLLVYDEIQSGYGRTGALFHCLKHGVMPDVLVAAKGFGGGMPLAAMMSSKDILSALTDNPVLGHITTFGGHPISCAASLAALNFIEKESLMAHVASKESLFRSLLIHPEIIRIDGEGLLLALQMRDAVFCRKVIDACVESGLLIDWFLYAEDKIRLSPPLIIKDVQIRKICGIIIENIEKAMQPSHSTLV